MLTPRQIVQTLSDRFGDRIRAAFPDDKHPRVHVDAGDWSAVAELLLTDPALKLDWLQCLSGVDYVADGKMCCVYDLRSRHHAHGIAIKVYCPRDPPPDPNVPPLWPAAEWHEREA